MPSVEDVVKLLSAREETVSTCESLTAGLVAARLAEVAGASTVLRGGIITYATELKNLLAQVPWSILEQGVVTQETAIAMAQGVRKTCGSDWVIATTGAAGPDPCDGVAAGTVWIAVVGADTYVAQQLLLTGDRSYIRQRTVAESLTLLWQQLSK